MTETPFATPANLAARWRPLTPEEQTRVGVLLEDASQLILDEGYDPERVAPATLERIVCDMVKRAMSVPGGLGVGSIQQGAGPYQETLTFSNPTGDLYLTKAERRQLSGGRRHIAFAVDLLPPGAGDPDPLEALP